jgi:hypothetical protein
MLEFWSFATIKIEYAAECKGVVASRYVLSHILHGIANLSQEQIAN